MIEDPFVQLRDLCSEIEREAEERARQFNQRMAEVHADIVSAVRVPVIYLDPEKQKRKEHGN